MSQKEEQISNTELQQAEEYLTVEDKVNFYREYLDIYEHQAKEKMKLFRIFQENCLKPDFKHSTRACMALIFIPTAVNIFFVFRPYTMFKNSIRVGTIIGCYMNFMHNLRVEFGELVKQDTPVANLARQHYQNIAKYDVSTPDYAKYTLQIASK